MKATRAEFDKALQPVLADLRAGCPDLVLCVEIELERSDVSARIWERDGSGTGVWLRDGTEVEQLLELLEAVQDLVLEALPAIGKPACWPACPFHPDRHPLTATEENGRAFWYCPLTRRGVAEVGRLD